MPTATPPNEVAICSALSAQRASTYVAAAGGDTVRAVALYGWNARIAAALMVPAHFAEVTTRNAVSDALTSLYGSKWPWNETLRNSLPNPGRPAFSPRQNLVATAGRQPSTGKVIAELKFVFWASMFTSRHDTRIWEPLIHSLFPNSYGLTSGQLRSRIHGDLEIIRQLRNRIAHHEPIITRQLSEDLIRMVELIELRCSATASWVRAMEDVTGLLAARP